MPKDLRSFLQAVKEEDPKGVVTVSREVDPRFEITAILRLLEQRGEFPIVEFLNVKSIAGRPSGFRVAANVFATRQNIATALDLPRDRWRMELSLEFARKASQRVSPVVVPADEAPVQEVKCVGDEVNLFALPVPTHHAMDGQPYMVAAVVARDPDAKAYNSSHHRQLVRDERSLGIWMSPRHLWNYFRRAESRGKPLPIAHVHGHHPGFFLGSEALVPMEDDEYEVIGGILGEPLRLVPSVSFGDDLLVPADAEVVVEGEIMPSVRDSEGPFGEFTGYYGPQRWGPVVRVTAITHRKDPIWLNILVGHPDTSLLGGIPKEASTLDLVRAAVPTVKAVHFPMSGCCRFHAYISISKKMEGEAVTAALAALPHHDELKHVVVVDDDVDPFNESEVLWAIATRVQPDEDVHIVRNARGGVLDPAAVRTGVGSKMIIDATRPKDRPFAERISVPDEVMRRIDLGQYID